MKGCLRDTLLTVLLTACGGCGVPSSGARVTEEVPDRASFPEVAQAMEAHCGTLDCHGTVYRNMKIYGNTGLRWASSDRPTSPPCTTSAEVDADFDSVVGLEPEAMSTVVQQHGANPTLLTMIRKARGTESHKGGTVMKPGDDLDTCITSWLGAATQTTACESVAPPTAPPPAPGASPLCEPGP